ncbi:hypothetical protein O3G_MSEX007333 [Manduca sexta]|uniref:Larval cuticle protein 1-like n=1 Tax=Manduca sexta TaxID=7130 RepID=A0A921Z5K7_MANSE|nr:hypothetical protein O3G_MSEX007333 [Manduca sexta]
MPQGISCSSVANRRKPNPIKMKLVILVAVALAAVAVAAPPEPAKIIKSEYDIQPQGNFVYSFETENGIGASAVGELKEVVDEDNKPRPVIVLRGSYGYTNPEGIREEIIYYADETGYHAEGPSIPKAPVARR